MEKLGIGIIGCGNISTAYLRLAPLFKGLEVRAVADLNMEAAQARASEFGVAAQTVEDDLIFIGRQAVFGGEFGHGLLESAHGGAS